MKNVISIASQNDVTLPVCAVLLTTHNGSKFLAAQVDSILAQQDVIPIIYARDDGSSDTTNIIMGEYAARFPQNVRLLPDYGRRFGAACENFLSILRDTLSHGHELYAFADQDDIWLPAKLSRAIRQLSNNQADAYAANLTAFSEGDGSEWAIRKATRQRRFDHLFQSASAGCTYVMTRAAAELITSRIGPLEESDWQGMSHDWLCYAICRSHGLRWYIDDWSGIRYRQHAQNQFGALPGWQGALARLKLLSGGWYRTTVLKNHKFLDSSNAAEQEVIARVAALGWTDRLWLALRAFQFRRETTHALALAAALLTGRF